MHALTVTFDIFDLISYGLKMHVLHEQSSYEILFNSSIDIF